MDGRVKREANLSKYSEADLLVLERTAGLVLLDVEAHEKKIVPWDMKGTTAEQAKAEMEQVLKQIKAERARRYAGPHNGVAVL